MTFDFYGNPETIGKITPLVKLIESVDANQLWDYCGLSVTIDPTVDYNEQDVLVRWLDMDEGVNDKIIVYSLDEFNAIFTAIND